MDTGGIGMKKVWQRMLAFGLPVAVMLVIIIAKGIYPFGDRSFLFMDMYHQYMPFFRELMRAVREGDGLQFTWNVGIGSNFLALYVYYLSCPLNWLALLVPDAYLCEFMTALIVFKIGLCGLTSYYYLEKTRRHPGWWMLAFSCAYALSGFIAAYNWDIMWLDCVYLLPLIVLGLERLVREGRCALYVVTLALSVLMNYYISIMICIFLVLYFAYLYLTQCGGWEHRARAYLRPVGRFAVSSLLAGGLAAVLLIPEVCAILATDFGEIDFPDTVDSYFSVLDMLARHCVCVQNERKLAHWPNIYCGSFVLLLVPLYATNERIPARERFGKLALAGFLLLGFSTNVLNFIWHGLNWPDSLPARQSFLYIFLILIMCGEAADRLALTHAESKKRLVTAYLGAVAFLLFVEKFADSDHFEWGTCWLTLLFVTIYAVCLYRMHTLVQTRGGDARRTLASYRCTPLFVILVAAAVCETGINMYTTSVGTVSRGNYLGKLDDYRALYAQTQEEEDGFYRVEKLTRTTKNDGALVGMPTASVFSSTLNSDVMDLYDRLGMRHSKVYYDFDGATAFTSALLNVNYLFAESGAYENELLERVGESGGVYLYEAQYTLPFGYVAPTGYDLPDGYSDSPLGLQNEMARMLGVKDDLFEKQEVEDGGETVTFTAPEDGVYYGVVTASGTSKLEVTGGSPDKQTFADLKDGCVVYLGELKAGQTIRIKNGSDDDETPEIRIDIYRMNTEALSETLAVLSEQSMENVTYDSDSVYGEITLTSAGRVILSVPAEAGWTVTVNGEETEPQTFGGALIALDLEPGEYTIELEYTAQGSGAGIAVSAVSLILSAAWIAVSVRRKRRMQAACGGSGGNRDLRTGRGKSIV